jgi:endonuclease/exonuclease/phosphatase family metal-dependent hydrolase
MNTDTLSTLSQFHGNQKPCGWKLRLLSYNIHVGIPTSRCYHYLTRSWWHILPHPERLQNLGSIARLIRNFDVVGLQELDGGSLRSGFINQTEYLGEKAGFPFRYDKVNRNMGMVAQHTMGVLSRLASTGVSTHCLPSGLPGRSALVVRFGDCDDPLELVLVHLALSTRWRMQQIDYLSKMVRGYRHVILMGDLNCSAHSKEMDLLRKKTNLHLPFSGLPTYPSWKPRRHIDHILVSPSIQVEKVQVLNHSLSDHLPIAMEVSLPDNLGMNVARTSFFTYGKAS